MLSPVDDVAAKGCQFNELASCQEETRSSFVSEEMWDKKILFCNKVNQERPQAGAAAFESVFRDEKM